MNTSILIVENNKNFLKTIQEHIQNKRQYKGYPASSREEAEKLLQARSYAAAVVDVHLLDDEDPNDWSGLVLARYLGDMDIPVIILTAYDKPEDVERAYHVVPGRPQPTAFVSKNQEHWHQPLLAELDKATNAKV